MKTKFISLLIVAFALAGCAQVRMVDQTGNAVQLSKGGVRRITKKVAVEYPAHLRNQSITGVVVVRIWVRPDGTIAKTENQSSPNPELSRLAQEALMQWRFEPAADGEKRMLVLAEPITFDLDEETKDK